GKALKLIPTDVGRSIGDIKPNIQAPDLDQLVQEVMESMTVKDVEAQDKQGYWYHLQVRPYRTADNKIDGAVIALLDIDSLKRNAEALKAAAEEIKKARDDAATIIESQPIPLLVVDSRKRVKLANEIFYEKFQVSPGETLDRLVTDLGSGQWKVPALEKLIDLTLTRGEKFQGFEVDHEFPRIGHKVMLLSSRKVQLAGSGEIAALLAIEDMTARHRIERALKNSEEKYRSLIANAHDGIVIVGENGKIEFANRQAETMFGYTPGEFLNQPVELLVPDRHRKSYQSFRNRYFEQAVAKEMGPGIDLYGKRKDGTEIAVDVSLSPTKTNGVLCVTAIVRDISERKEVERGRAELLLKEQRASAVKDEFLATLSHELRTPLTTILSWSQMIRTGKLDAEKTRHGVEIIEQSAKAQGQLIDDLLDISRIQAGKLNLSIQKIDPGKIISAALDSTRNLAAAKSIQIETDIASSVGQIYADPSRLQQIIWNLVTNSIKFSANKGRVWVEVQRVSAGGEDCVVIEIRDNGKGIKAEFVPVIFERFTQVDSSSTRTYGGLGLGLAIVKKLVEMHGGKVEVESPGEGKGATFTVTLPAKPVVKPEASASKAETEAQAMADATLEGLRILLVDDEANAREVFSFMLQSFGGEVKTAASAAEALERFNEFKPDVVVSDIAMPLEDGYSLVSKIRALKSKRRNTPALALTAYAAREDVQRAYKAGFQAHVAKPVEANKLALAIAKIVGRK
ncbi:MAG: PAS domain S-box protein, partial [Deltaproteobacteria bacterium]|nr:PAS domain S-box protein [Deltaproteobacteria bacterium]